MSTWTVFLLRLRRLALAAPFHYVVPSVLPLASGSFARALGRQEMGDQEGNQRACHRRNDAQRTDIENINVEDRSQQMPQTKTNPTRQQKQGKPPRVATH